MAPGPTHRESKKAGLPRQAENRRFEDWGGSMFLLLDVLDDLGHIVLVLAQFRGILEELLVLLFSLFQRYRLLLFLLLDRFRFFGFEFGVELVGANRLQLLFNRRRGAGAARFQERLRVKRSAAFRADDRLAHQIVVTGTATRTNPLGAPFGFGHHSLHKKFSKSRRSAIATATLPCQKQTSNVDR